MTTILWAEREDVEGVSHVAMGNVPNPYGFAYLDNPVALVEVPYTAWGDYCGGAVERANYRALGGDGPDDADIVSDRLRYGIGGYDSHCVYLLLPDELSAQLRDDEDGDDDDAMDALREYAREHPDDDNLGEIVDAIDALVDYPLVNEETWSEVEEEIARESWDSFGWDDVQREARDRAGDEHEDAIEDALDDTDGDLAYAWLRTEYDRTGYDWGEVETATSAYFRTDDIGDAIAAHWAAHGTLPWDAWRARVERERNNHSMF